MFQHIFVGDCPDGAGYRHYWRSVSFQIHDTQGLFIDSFLGITHSEEQLAVDLHVYVDRLSTVATPWTTSQEQKIVQMSKAE